MTRYGENGGLLFTYQRQRPKKVFYLNKKGHKKRHSSFDYRHSIVIVNKSLYGFIESIFLHLWLTKLQLYATSSLCMKPRFLPTQKADNVIFYDFLFIALSKKVLWVWFTVLLTLSSMTVLIPIVKCRTLERTFLVRAEFRRFLLLACVGSASWCYKGTGA